MKLQVRPFFPFLFDSMMHLCVAHLQGNNPSRVVEELACMHDEPNLEWLTGRDAVDPMDVRPICRLPSALTLSETSLGRR